MTTSDQSERGLVGVSVEEPIGALLPPRMADAEPIRDEVMLLTLLRPSDVKLFKLLVLLLLDPGPAEISSNFNHIQQHTFRFRTFNLFGRVLNTFYQTFDR